MAEVHAERGEVNARIVYWGPEGSGKTTNVRAIHRSLKPDHRGRLAHVPTPLDPTQSYEMLPIELGEMGGLRTRLQIIAVPGAPEQAPTRKQLLDRVDGVVFVVDAQRERIDDDIASFEELRRALSAYGRSLEDVPLVIQYNKRDRADAYALEELHRKLAVEGAAAFEAVATEAVGVLQTLTTISKRVIRHLRDQPAAGQPEAPAAPSPARAVPAAPRPSARPAPPPPPPPSAPEQLEQAILAEPDQAADLEVAAQQAQGVFDASWSELAAPAVEAGSGAELRVVGVGAASLASDGSVLLPLDVAADDGPPRRLRLRLRLEGDAEPDPHA
jgi:hypothetical protein